MDSLNDPPDWTFGGGTALAVHLDHRVSYDIDAFVRDSDVIRNLTPGRNPFTKQLLDGRKYEYPGNYLKLYMDGGEIDVIIASRRTDNPTMPWVFETREISIETPWETVIKKIFYRPSNFKVRDVFDFAAVIEHSREELWNALPEVENKLDKLVDRIERLAPSYVTMAAQDVNPTEHGRRYMTAAAPAIALDFLSARSHRPTSAN